MSEIEQVLHLQREAYLLRPVSELSDRQADLRQLRRFVVEHQDAICEAVSQDFGHRSRHETLMCDIMPTVLGIDYVLKHLARWMKPQSRPADWRLFFGARNRLVPQALGVVGVIVPWNFPVFLSFGPLTYALAAGNRAMVKMSEHSRELTRFLIAQMPKYFPPEKLQFFEETGSIGPTFAALKFDHLMFTGSSRTGRSVMRAAAANLCPVTLELGGKTPAIVCPDFDLHSAAERIWFAKLLNAGQICVAVDYVWLPKASCESFTAMSREIVRKRIGSLDSVDYTAIISDHAFERLLSALEEARGQGAKVICLLDGAPYDRAQRKIAPHLVLDAPPGCALMQEEIFGPILPVRPYAQLDDVLVSLKDAHRPLAIYPFSHDRGLIDRLLTHVMSGGVSVNNVLFHFVQAAMPVGGVGESGMGQIQGWEGFATFSKMRPIYYQPPWNASRLFWPPYTGLIERLLRYFTR